MSELAYVKGHLGPIDEAAIGDGAVGPITRRIERAYREHTGRTTPNDRRART